MKLMPKNKNGGVVTSTIMGVGGLIIGVIVILVIVSTLNNANLVAVDSTDTFTKLNESITFDVLNTPQVLSANSIPYVTCNAITHIHNQTRVGVLLGVTNITRTGCSIINATNVAGDFIGNGTLYVSYTYTRAVADTRNTITNLTSNFTQGIGNVSQKIPTILLIVAVVFLFGALVLLIRNAQSMGMFGGGGQGSL
jgi:energy-coupling factor transporter transmembrane protein EcfT